MKPFIILALAILAASGQAVAVSLVLNSIGISVFLILPIVLLSTALTGYAVVRLADDVFG